MEDRCPTTASPVTMQNWVHKRSAAQVLVRAIRTSTTSMATLDVHWSPDIDAVFRCLGAYSPLIVIETVRQSVIATAHHLLGVELGTAFMMREIDVEFLGFASIRDVSEEGVSLTVEVECAARIRNTQHWTIRIRVDDSDVARATGISMLAVQPLYARLRGGRAHKLIESVKVEANRSLSSADGTAAWDVSAVSRSSMSIRTIRSSSTTRWTTCRDCWSSKQHSKCHSSASSRSVFRSREWWPRSRHSSNWMFRVT